MAQLIIDDRAVPLSFSALEKIQEKSVVSSSRRHQE
jgi:hypothetical protein